MNASMFPQHIETRHDADDAETPVDLVFEEQATFQRGYTRETSQMRVYLSLAQAEQLHNQLAGIIEKVRL